MAITERQPNSTEQLIAEFVAGNISLPDIIQKLGKSRATIYRYAKMVMRGEEIFDRRTLGNNRKYGK